MSDLWVLIGVDTPGMSISEIVHHLCILEYQGGLCVAYDGYILKGEQILVGCEHYFIALIS